MDTKEFEGKYAIVTGATSGICATAAKLFAQRGLAGIVIVGRNEGRAKAVAAECESYGCKAYVSLCDISKVDDIRRTIDYATKVLPQVDILVNGAAISPYDDPWDVETVEHFDMIINNNLRSQFVFCQSIAKLMIPRGYGKIVNFSSVVARTGSGISISYSASKAGVLGMTRSFAKAVSPKGINVNAICAGIVETPMLSGHDYSDAAQAWPMRRTGTATELAEAVLFLASDKSGYMTGAGLDVNGGYTFS